MSDTQTDKPALRWTAGPWHVTRGLYGDKDGLTIWAPKNEEGAHPYVCSVDGIYNRAADAALIAAAPDMASALLKWEKFARDNYADADISFLAETRAALRKAGADV